MRAVWKFPLEPKARQTIDMPGDAQFLHVGEQRGRICIWAGVTPTAPLKPWTIQIVGTGFEEIPEKNIWHLGTVVMKDGDYVWHVFDATVTIGALTLLGGRIRDLFNDIANQLPPTTTTTTTTTTP